MPTPCLTASRQVKTTRPHAHGHVRHSDAAHVIRVSNNEGSSTAQLVSNHRVRLSSRRAQRQFKSQMNGKNQLVSFRSRVSKNSMNEGLKCDG